MAVTLDGQLVVAISSRALFDFEEENQVFESGSAQGSGPDAPPGVKKDAAYMKMQLERLDIPARPGVAFSLVKKLLAFNDAPESAGEAASPAVPRQRVEVVILSRNDPVSGMRVFRSAQASACRSSAACSRAASRPGATCGRSPPTCFYRPT